MTESTNFSSSSLASGGVLISGGTSGVGLASAVALAVNGAPKIVLMGRDAVRGQAACATVRTMAPDAQVHFIACDANQPAQAGAAVEQALERMGRIDLLVNATVGPYVPRLLHDTPVEDVAPLLDSFLLAPLLMTRLVLPHMQRQRCGSIINIASDAGKIATPGESLIGAAMAAIVMFTRATAMEAKRDGVRVNVVTPSLIHGTLTHERITRDGFSARLFEKAQRLAELGATQPQDVAALIVFLASPAARLITGQAISVNGGISAA